MARSLKRGCNDHITKIAIIQDKLVESTVKAKSNKRQKTTLKGQERLKGFLDQKLDEEIAAQEATKAATEKRRLKKQASDKNRTTRLKKQATDKIKTSSAREAAAQEAEMDKRIINIENKVRTDFLKKKKKESEATKRKKAVKKNNVGGKEKVKKNKEQKRLDAAENKWDKMVKVVDDRKAAEDKKKKESEAAKNKKNKGGRKKKDETQYEIQAIVGHEIGIKSKKVARLSIRWVGDSQITLEPVKDIKETAWEMVEEYAKKKNITI